MKRLILIAGLLLGASAFAQDTVTGDKILFQAESTYVSALYNRTLCLDGEMYRAIITKCVAFDRSEDRECIRYGKVAAEQPMYSTRQRCSGFSGDECEGYETVPFYQSPVRTVKFYRNDDLVKTMEIAVPSCQ